jgi:hypothetical protein
MVPENLRKLNAMVDTDFSSWIEAIQKATIRQLQSSDEWEEDESILQVKKMTADDLEKESRIPIPQVEHDFDERLYVIKLPMPIPTETYSPVPQFLFLRADELVLFDCFGRHRWCILIGNPGISKSWFQWKFILLCYRPDLYQQLRSNEAEEAVQSRASNSKGSIESFFELNNKPFIPNLILRTIAGRESLLFFFDRPDVYFIQHTPESLRLITDGNSTILWEPDEGNTPVKYKSILSRIIATVSPDMKRIHEFQKNARSFYMPCPSELQIRLMGLIYRKYAMDQDIITDEKIHLRVQKYGPFIRNALCWLDIDFKAYERARNDDIRRICATDLTMRQAFETSTHIMEDDKVSSGSSCLSHRLARFVVDRDNTICCETYADIKYRFSSEEILNLFYTEIGKMKIEAVMAHLIEVNRYLIGIEDSTPIFFERLFMLHSLTGIEWKCRQMPVGQSVDNTIDWKPFNVKLKYVERTITSVESMKSGVLYYPADRTFPLVDMYYKNEEGKLNCIQATFAKNHAKKLSTYQKFFDAIGISPENQKVNLFYLILPRNIKYYSQEFNAEGKFWKNPEKVEIETKWKDCIEFHALLPPDTFEARLPKIPELEDN